MNAIAGWLLGIGALLLGGLWMPALVVALVAVAFNAAKPDLDGAEPVATLDVRSWEEPMPTAKDERPLSPEKMRVHDFLIGECSVHDCPDCGEGLVSVRIHDGHPVKRCNRCTH